MKEHKGVELRTWPSWVVAEKDKDWYVASGHADHSAGDPRFQATHITNVRMQQIVLTRITI